MWPIQRFARAALSVSLLSGLPSLLGMLPLLAERSSVIAGDDVLQMLKPVTDDMLKRPDPQDWLMRRGDYRAWGYSALDQITAQNVSRLKLAWAWNMEPGYQEEAPLAHDGIVFLANPKNVVQRRGRAEIRPPRPRRRRAARFRVRRSGARPPGTPHVRLCRTDLSHGFVQAWRSKLP
jgi:hypothetical protein